MRLRGRVLAVDRDKDVADRELAAEPIDDTNNPKQPACVRTAVSTFAVRVFG